MITILAPGTHEVAPRGVNDAGIVVGAIGTDSDRGAFLYDGSMTDLQPALETHAGDARDITNSGVVVGARPGSPSRGPPSVSTRPLER